MDIENLLKTYYKGKLPGTQTPDCPDDETITSFVDGELTEKKRSEVEMHVSYCDFCLDIIAALKKMERVSEEDYPPEVVEGAERASLKFLEQTFGRRTFTFQAKIELPDLLPKTNAFRLAARMPSIRTHKFEEEDVPFVVTLFDFEEYVDMVVETKEARFKDAELRVAFLERDVEKISTKIRLRSGVWEGKFSEKADIPPPEAEPYTLRIIVTGVSPSA